MRHRDRKPFDSVLAAAVAAALALPAWPHLAAAACVGPNLSIASIAMKATVTHGSLNYYTVAGRVTNTGNRGQSSNALQFVDIFQGGQRIEDRGIPPLARGRSYAFTYTWQRATDAGANSTTLIFRLRSRSPVPSEVADCATGQRTYRITF